MKVRNGDKLYRFLQRMCRYFASMAVYNSEFEPIANYFLALANKQRIPISNLKLQKLVYYAQAWYLAMKEKELFYDDFEAWIHGPVIPALYVQYSQFRWENIERKDLDEKALERLSESLGEKKVKFLNRIAEQYFPMSPKELEMLTHGEQPFLQAREGLREDESSHNIIDKDLMKKYYIQFLKK